MKDRLFSIVRRAAQRDVARLRNNLVAQSRLLNCAVDSALTCGIDW